MYQGLSNQTRPVTPGGTGDRGSSPIRTRTPGTAWPTAPGRISDGGAMSAVMIPFSVVP